MQLRYSFRLYPTRGQQAALGRAFGCARVVYSPTAQRSKTRGSCAGRRRS
ncbi:helix-turn-helix domain-containing protein [Streptomyces sp. NPDC059262]